MGLLYEVSASDDLSRLVLDNIRISAPLLDYVHFFYSPGGTAKVRMDANVNTAATFRTIGFDYASPLAVTPSYANYSLTTLGRPMRLDVGYEEEGGDIPSEMRRELASFGLTLGRNINEFLVVGDSTQTPVQFNGLKKTVAALAASQTLTNMGANGTQILAGISDAAVSSQMKFKEALQQLIMSVAFGAQCLVMNSLVWARLSSFAAAECDSTVDQYGRLINTFNGVPVVHAGFKFDGSEIIPQTETKGTSTDCSSVYAFRSGAKEFFSMMTTKNGLRVYPMTKVGNFYEQLVELRTDSQALNVRSVSVLPGVRLG